MYIELILSSCNEVLIKCPTFFSREIINMKYRMKYFQCRETFATKRTKQVNLIEISSDECEFEHDLEFERVCNIFFLFNALLN